MFAIVLLAGTALPAGAAERLEFEATAPEFAGATAEYEAIWSADGVRIVAALESATDLVLEPGPIRVLVHEGVSSSGYRHIPMRMRASYPLDTKRATLVHELSHRLVGDLFRKDDQDHPYIFLFLYDVWVEIWGKEFADAQVAVESRRKGLYDYEGAWQDALAIGKQGRREEWRKFLESRRLPEPPAPN
jgi:hypothetical protein